MSFPKMKVAEGQSQAFRRLVNRKTRMARKIGDRDYVYAQAFVSAVDTYERLSGAFGASILNWKVMRGWVDSLEHAPSDEARAYYERRSFAGDESVEFAGGATETMILVRAACWYLGERGVDRGVRYEDFKYRWES